VSPLDSVNQPGVVVQKPKADVYTVMLCLSLAAILLAIGFLAWEWAQYDFKTSPEGVSAAPTVTLAPRGTGTLPWEPGCAPKLLFSQAEGLSRLRLET
jgi:hypothetical protein